MHRLKIFEEAEDQWPEEEAGLAAAHAIELFNMEGKDYCHQWVIKERVHWTSVFDSSDMKRFTERFNAIAFPIIDIAM